jgi:phosphoribosylaminoimidazole-succinocarboxamide synthase
MEKKEMLYEGKAKKVYTTEDPDVLIVSYKDDATAFNGLKKGTIVGKGAINNRMTNFIFKKLEEKGVPTHLVEELNNRETAVKKVEIVPLEVIIRNYSAGSFAKKMGMEASSSNARPWNSAIRTTTWATRLSTAITRWLWDLPPRRRLTISLNMRLK